MFREAFSHCIGTDGQDSAPALYYQSNLGEVLILMDKAPEAENLLRRTLLKQREVHPRNKADHCRTMYYLAHLCWKTGSLEEAEDFFERALSGQISCLGPEHERTLETITRYGQFLLSVGKTDEAKEKLDIALEVRKYRLPSSSPNLLQTLHAHALLKRRQGKEQEALEAFKYVLECSTISLGADHPQSIQARKELQEFPASD